MNQFEKNKLDSYTVVQLKNGVVAEIMCNCVYHVDKKMRYTIKERRGIYDIFPHEIDKVLSISNTIADWNVISNADLLKQLLKGDKQKATKIFLKRYKRMPHVKKTNYI